MRPWTRLQDFATLIAGAYAALSPIWVNTTGERDAFWTLIALGALLAVAALVSLALPGVVATEALTMLFGVLLFVARGCSPTPTMPPPRRPRGSSAPSRSCSPG